MTTKIILLLIVILASVCMARAQSRINFTLPTPNPFTEMLPVDFCAVTQNPHRYDGKTLRVRGILWQSFEGSVLFSNQPGDCDGLRVIRDCPNGGCEQLERQLRESLDGKLMARSLVTVVGRFKYRKFLTYRESRLGFSRYEFQISKIEEIVKLEDR